MTSGDSTPESSTPPPPRATREESGYYEPYAEYHRNLRVWFIAYGVGAPVLFTQIPGGIDMLHQAGTLGCIAILFLSGVLLQVLTAVVYKSAMWYLYMEDLDHLESDTKRYVVSDWISGAYWLELFLDLITIGLFASASWMALSVIASAA